MINRMNHVSFTVSNLQRSIDFYQKALGLELISLAARDMDFTSRLTGIPGAEMKVAYLKAADSAVELIQYLTPPGEKLDTRTCNVGSAHVALNVDDLKAVLARALAAGAVTAGEVVPVPAGPNKGKPVVYLEDPDGNTIELIGDRPL